MRVGLVLLAPHQNFTVPSQHPLCMVKLSLQGPHLQLQCLGQAVVRGIQKHRSNEMAGEPQQMNKPLLHGGLEWKKLEMQNKWGLHSAGAKNASFQYIYIYIYILNIIYHILFTIYHILYIIYYISNIIIIIYYVIYIK